MAHERHNGVKFPGIAIATLVGPLSGGGAMPVKSAPTGTQPRAVLPIATYNELPLGIALAKAQPAASGAEYPAAVTVHGQGNTVKVVAGASIGVGAEVNIASSNGAMGPVAAASGSLRYTIGQSETPAAAGEVFSLYVNPRPLSGTP
jgi:hypothetical protein